MVYENTVCPDVETLVRQRTEIMEKLLDAIEGKNMGVIVPCLASVLCQSMADTGVPRQEATGYITMCLDVAYDLINELPDQVH